jgi:hypothetical protein
MSRELRLGSLDPNSYKLPTIDNAFKVAVPGHNKELRKSQMYVPIVNYDAVPKLDPTKLRSRTSLDLVDYSTENAGSRVLEKIGARYG